MEFEKIEDAKEACEQLHGTRINGREITGWWCTAPAMPLPTHSTLLRSPVLLLLCDRAIFSALLVYACLL